MVAACGGKTTTTTTTTPTTTTTTQPAEPAKFDWTRFPRVDIVEVYGLISPSYLRDLPKIADTLGEAGVPQAEQEAVLAGNDESAWPAPFASDQRWNNNNIYEMVLIRSRHVAYLPNKQRLVVALAGENQHLKPDARPTKDFFLVYTDESVKPIDTVPERKQTDGAFDYTQLVATYIVDPGQIISGYEVRSATNIRDILVGAGIPETEHENVFARSNESGWPYLMSNFDQRIANPDILKQFVVRRVAVIDGSNTLVMMPAAENAHMPEGWRPDQDIYAVFATGGVN
jgi:hypothetical protein